MKPLAASEGTLYPLLRRLQREGLIDASWQESADGPPRKYYRLTPTGSALLQSQLAEWEQLTEAVALLRASGVAGTSAISSQRSAISPLVTADD